MYHIYIIQSRKDKSLYIGFTERKPDDRLNDHNTSKVPSSKNKRPWDLIYYEGYKNKRDALGREKFLKGGSGRKYLKKQLANYLQETN